ncbi:hypothetical protein CFN78_14220 [Amycolatopsis antarctica]|uniref:Uncharacterized protein n=1 Tax=Amycolatopsis antarctica TaxID=1854586 RepID=A0A263D5L4_9PSEU|nr:hypothetical protein [Amycolatopsis antarctica]OZM72766.1 hypothetical protein CFN78_14220 [Amycolatopsis antarctica]
MRQSGLGASVLLAVLAAVQLIIGTTIVANHFTSTDSLPVWLAVVHIVMGLGIGAGVLLELRKHRSRPTLDRSRTKESTMD